jgi:hypothetical protein
MKKKQRTHQRLARNSKEIPNKNGKTLLVQQTTTKKNRQDSTQHPSQQPSTTNSIDTEQSSRDSPCDPPNIRLSPQRRNANNGKYQRAGDREHHARVDFSGELVSAGSSEQVCHDEDDE